jgi:hypothetical protein
MDLFYRLIEKKWVILLAGAIIGLVLGVFYAWVIDPVKWKDGTPAQLRDDLRQDYLRMAIDSYSINNDENLAIDRYEILGKYAKETLEKVGANPAGVSSYDLQNFRAVVESFILEIPQETSGGGTAESPQEGGFLALIFKILPYFCGAIFIIAVVVLGIILIRRRMKPAKDDASSSYQDFDGYQDYYDEEEVDTRLMNTTGSSSKDPLATFRTIYSLGDDLYDDSFSIESPTGDFLGECGVGIGDIIGVGDPKKVSAFEIWLFDKSDIQTETKVLLSTYAYNDIETRNRLAAKGDPVLAQNGGIIDLETESLRVEARIVDMTYGEGALPSDSFFERIAIELRAYYVAR